MGDEGKVHSVKVNVTVEGQKTQQGGQKQENRLSPICKRKLSLGFGVGAFIIFIIWLFCDSTSAIGAGMLFLYPITFICTKNKGWVKFRMAAHLVFFISFCGNFVHGDFSFASIAFTLFIYAVYFGIIASLKFISAYSEYVLNAPLCHCEACRRRRFYNYYCD